MAATVTLAGAVTLLGAGASFLALAWGLGLGLARSNVTLRDEAGRIRPKACALVAGAFALLIVGHALLLWWLELYHPAVNAFYVSCAAIPAVTLRAKRGATPSHPR